MRKTRKTLVAMAAAAALAVTLTACGSDDGTSESSSSAAAADSNTDSNAGSGSKAGDHNAQDVTFAQGMIPHHRGALEMAEEAAEKASSAEVKSLAARIQQAQAPEIETMSGWLKTWGEDVPTSTESMEGMDMDMESMPGMDHGATGGEFDKNFLTMMIEHHEGAVKMATTEKAEGKYGPATAMADDVIRTQNAEITEMNKLLDKS